MINFGGKNAHEPLFVLRQHDNPILSSSFYPSPDNNDESKLFISGDTGGTVIVWDLSLRRPLLMFKPAKWAGEQNPTNELSALSVEGVLAVGFFCPRNASIMKPVLGCNASRNPLIRPGEQSALSTKESAGPNSGAVSASFASERPPRRRFRILRDSLYPNANKMKHMKSIYIFTQCRNQRLYIWDCKLDDEKPSSLSNYTTPLLLHTVQVPQHGFCAVASYCDGNGSTVLAVPHDAQGVISLWHVSFVSTINGKESTKHQTPRDTLVECFPSTYGHTSDASLDTTVIGPHDALGACGTAKQGPQHCTLPNTRPFLDDVQSSRVANATVDSTLNLRFLGSSCTCKGFKGGTIMYICIKNEHHLIVSFESGHVVLCQYQASSHDAQHGNRGMTPCKETNLMLRILGIVRAFPEPSMVCLYHTQRVLVTSTEGRVHSYRLICQNPEMVKEGLIHDSFNHSTLTHRKDTEQSEPIHFYTVWQRKFNKGLGSAVLQDDFAVLGCWDHSLRVLDARTGEVLSTLPFHTETVNSVCIAPSAVAMEASFGFDPRQPQCYEYQPRINESSSDDLHEESAGVYVFASASKDGCIALWRVDFFEIVKKGREVEGVSSGSFGQKKEMLDIAERG